MIATAFDYVAPASVEAAVATLADGEATILGGGSWVVPELSSGIRAPERVLDLRWTGLDRIDVRGDEIRLGAMTTYAQLLRDAGGLGVRGAMLTAMASGITGGPQLRNVGTIGGSACYATPASEVPAVLVALEASLQLVGPRGARTVTAEEFFVDAFACAAAPDEIVVHIALPPQGDGVRVGYRKLKLSESSYPIATGACVVRREGDGSIASARVVVGAACAVPKVIPVDDLVAGRHWADVLDEVADRTREACAVAYADVLADAGYRREISGVAAKRALAMAGEAA